jgi:hypothetical protein
VKDGWRWDRGDDGVLRKFSAKLCLWEATWFVGLCMLDCDGVLCGAESCVPLEEVTGLEPDSEASRRSLASFCMLELEESIAAAYGRA